MKRILIAATAIAALGFNTSAFAAVDASATVTMGGKVANTCTLGTPTLSSLNASLTPAASSSVVTFNSLANTNTAALNASGFAMNYEGMCNMAHQIQLKAANGGLRQVTPVAVLGGNFVERIGYTATATWGGQTASPAIDATSTGAAPAAAEKQDTKTVAGANAGTLVLQVTIPSNAAPVVAGDYTETLTLKVAATI